VLPPVGNLKRLREICDKHGILLIFDEVITGFGRLGTRFASDYFGVVPDIITCAKGLTNGAVPMGAVAVKREIHDAFMANSPANAIELPHGYTYTAHPIACAAAIATLDIFAAEKLEDRAAGLSAHFEQAAHSLKGVPFVKDVRNIGLVAGIELESIPGKPGGAAFATYLKCYEMGVLVRYTGDIIAISPPLTIEKDEIDRIFSAIGEALNALAAEGEAGLDPTRYLKNEQQWAAHQQEIHQQQATLEQTA
jgi:beta-alanine--pyruvate transaminase